MNKLTTILVLSLALTGLNPSTMNFVESGMETLSAFKVVALLWLGSLGLFLLTRQSRLMLPSFKVVPKYEFLNTMCLLLLTWVGIFAFSDIVLTSLANLVFHLAMFLVMYAHVKKMGFGHSIMVHRTVIWLYFSFMTFTALTYFLVSKDALVAFHSFDATSSLPHFRGLATEASHAAFIVLASYLALVILSRRSGTALQPSLHLAVLVMVLLCQSTFGFILYFCILANLFSLQFYRYRHLIISTFVSFFIFFHEPLVGYFVKLQGLLELVQTMDFDASAYGKIRTMILIIVIQEYETYSLLTQLFGHGVGSGAAYVTAVSEGEFADGQFGTFVYEFGIVGVLLLLFFFLLNISKRDFGISVVFLVLLIFNSNVAGQMYWWVLLALFSLRIHYSAPKYVAVISPSYGTVRSRSVAGPFQESR